jgi:DNA repair exonuclease SbcCD ATPase subunit
MVQTYDKEISIARSSLEGVDRELMEKCRDLTLAEVVAVQEHNQRIDWEMKDAIRLLQGEQRRAQDFLRDARAKTCRTCGQKVKDAMDEAELADKMAVIDGNIEQMQKDVKELDASRMEVVVTPQEFSTISEHKQIEDKISFLERQKNDLLEKIQNLHDERGDYNTNYEIMKFWEKAFSENGVVKFVIRNVLEYFNAKVNFYLSHLSQGKFFIEFDEALSETITHKGHTIHYISLSGGEKKKISLAVMLGLQSLLKISNTEDVNIMFFDEIAESLDAEGMEGLYILLSELKKSKTLYVITHNNYLKSLMDNAKTVTMIKSNGTSKLSFKK